MYEDFQDMPGLDGRIEFVTVVFEDNYYNAATRTFAESYAERYDFPFPTVADTAGDLLYYFDAASAPGNVMIDATQMRIHRVIQGFGQSGIESVLHILDGSVNCR